MHEQTMPLPSSLRPHTQLLSLFPVYALKTRLFTLFSFSLRTSTPDLPQTFLSQVLSLPLLVERMTIRLLVSADEGMKPTLNFEVKVGKVTG